MNAERGATGSIPSYPANGERETVAETDRRWEDEVEEKGGLGGWKFRWRQGRQKRRDAVAKRQNDE